MILEKSKQPRLRDLPRNIQPNDTKIDFLRDFDKINYIYRSAMQEASTRLDILDSEFVSIYDHSPIHHMESRIKSLDSLSEKMVRKGLELKLENVLLRENDYIRNPKPNGYRSLHLIVSVPFVTSVGKMELPVEIQLRTIAMDMWASLEHELRYKSGYHFSDEDSRTLLQCASALSEVDEKMQTLFKKTKM